MTTTTVNPSLTKKNIATMGTTLWAQYHGSRQ